MSRIACAVLCGLALFAVGCRNYVDFTVTSDPTNASVILDGDGQGDTPCDVRLQKDDGVHYMIIEKQGCNRHQKVFRHNKYPDDGDTIHFVLTPLAEAPTDKTPAKTP